MRKLVVLLLLSLFAAAPARADLFHAGEFTLAPGEDGDGYEFTASMPQTVDRPWKVTWPQGCRQELLSRQAAAGLVHYVASLACEGGLDPGDEISGPWRLDGATFTSNLDGTPVVQTVPTMSSGVTLAIGRNMVGARAVDAVALDYGWQGIIHIWMGWDHLAFVFCLCLIVSGRELLRLVTAFTLGHSVSLALAYFKVITVPIMPVEAIIALSIAFMAREALLARSQPEQPDNNRRYLVVVSLFGLLHGLGFASALDELGVAADEQVLGLVFFNVGVEVGQLLFVGAVAGIMWLLRNSAVLAPARVAALYAVGVLGSFWVFERVAGFTLLA